MKVASHRSPALILTCATIVLSTVTFAEDLSSEEVHKRSVHRRVVEAVIWGMPAVNYERMLQAATDNGAKLDQIVQRSRPVNLKKETLDGNWTFPRAAAGEVNTVLTPWRSRRRTRTPTT